MRMQWQAAAKQEKNRLSRYKQYPGQPAVILSSPTKSTSVSILNLILRDGLVILSEFDATGK